MKADQDQTECTVLYEDDWCLAVSKPSGLLTQAPPGIDSMESRIRNRLRDTTGKPYLGVPHRLDRPTSGVMIFARTLKAARRLAEQFQQRTVQKHYWALVEGRVEPYQGHWIDYLRKVENEPRAELASPEQTGAQRAELRYARREQFAQAAWLEIEPLTGRMHQIRLQASVRGHPVLGDDLYGSTHAFGTCHDDSRLNAVALHARSLLLRHPQTGDILEIEAPLPEAWETRLEALRREGQIK